MTYGAPSLFLKHSFLFQTQFSLLFYGFQAGSAHRLEKYYKSGKRERERDLTIYVCFFPGCNIILCTKLVSFSKSKRMAVGIVLFIVFGPTVSLGALFY